MPMNIGNVFSCAPTLRYTCHNQQRIITKPCSALGGGRMGGKESSPDLVSPKTLFELVTATKDTPGCPYLQSSEGK